MRVVPLTVRRANELIAECHRHNKPVAGCRFAIGAEDSGEIVGVATVGRPIARMVDFTKVAEVTRLCVKDGAPKNTCSFLYAACRRIWGTMGGEKIITYTLRRETGASLRGAGWVPYTVQKKGETGWLSRDREHQAVFDEAKIRWEIPTQRLPMKTLEFSNPVFHAGRNITCRRGIKWSTETHAKVAGIGVVEIRPQIIRFADLTDDMVRDEHDPKCRSVAGLLSELRRVYPGFHESEIITLVSFDVINPKTPTSELKGAA